MSFIGKLKKLKSRFLKGKTTENNSDFSKLKNLDRYTETTFSLYEKPIIVPDNASFVFMYEEIFKKHIYNFNSKKREPFIIDGGANIGLAMIYLKEKYPNSKILGFEPDSEIFKILRKNIDQYKFNNIELVNKGLWDVEGELEFQSEGADAGTISSINELNKSNTKVIGTSLNNYLDKEVDFLKLDIEGAETVVLNNIKSNLDKVKRIFVEYHSYVDKPQTIDEILIILIKAGFRLHINSPGLSSQSPFVELNTYNNMDMQLNIYGYKEDISN